MRTKYLVIFSLVFICIAFRYADDMLFVVPAHFPEPQYSFAENPLTSEKVLLGRALFYDPILSKDNSISCASCHSQFSAFTHVDHALSHGIDDQVGFRNSPALMNLAWQSTFMRDGAIHHLDFQALNPITNPVEMGEDFENVVSKLQASNIYPNLFQEAFGDSTITGEHLLKAISQFELTLVSSNSKYDSVLQNQTVFTDQESNGYILFKKNCSSCHTEPLFTNDQFLNNGLSVDTTLNDFGRYRVTRNSVDSLKFKVPTLRNIQYSHPYMHDGRFRKLSQVLNHYTDGIQESSTLADELHIPIELTSNEKVDLVAFLFTLTDRSFLYNPDYFYPREVFASGTKKINTLNR